MGLAVMKPVRTGFLANLPQVMREALASTGIRKPDTEWALDYLWDIPEVSVAVSGMGSMADVEENLRYAAKARPNMLSPAEREALGAAIYAYRHAPGHIDCTGCYQCIPCPHNVAIGYIFSATSSPTCTTTTSCIATRSVRWRTIPSRCPPSSAVTRHLRASLAANAWRSARSIWISPTCWRG